MNVVDDKTEDNYCEQKYKTNVYLKNECVIR